MSSVTVDKSAFYREGMAKEISELWFKWDSQREPKKREWMELRNYLFATDTSTTSNKNLPWKNSTTFPKLTQIRDNLHSNYISALFPNEEWLSWEAADGDSNRKRQAESITAYMLDRCKEGGFRDVVDRLIYDYIDYGNAFCTREAVFDTRETNEGSVEIFVGPRLKRISPYDIVFDATADSFEKAPKIVRKLISVGELKDLSETDMENNYLKDAFKKREHLRHVKKTWKYEDYSKADGFGVDGFGNYFEYLDSDVVELLEYYGDIYNRETHEYMKGRVITIMDRMFVLRNEEMETWDGNAPIWQVGWRLRPDNLWSAGPLDGLVGMQYRIDHLMNLKADAMDLAVLPPIVIKGEVEEFDYGPGSEIHIDTDGDVAELNKNLNAVIQAENDVQSLTAAMEEFAGAPKEAMGIRTPGEKTMFEVQQLQNAAGRIFQEKITRFEMFLEKALNSMLKVALQRLNTSQIVRVVKDDWGATIFREITKEDLNASGMLRPMGARHYSARSQLMQDLLQIFNSPIGQVIMPHVSAIELARLVEDHLGLKKFKLVSPNIGLQEQQEAAAAVNGMQEDQEFADQTMYDWNVA